MTSALFLHQHLRVWHSISDLIEALLPTSSSFIPQTRMLHFLKTLHSWPSRLDAYRVGQQGYTYSCYIVLGIWNPATNSSHHGEKSIALT